MGIRWYGWDVTAEEAERARLDPWAVIRIADDRHDVPGWSITDLDKAWLPLQRLFSDPRHERVFQPRPGFSLVEGDVRYLSSGEYEAHIGILSAEQVRIISDDVELVSRFDVRAFCRSWNADGPRRAVSEEGYVLQFLEQAKDFAADAASRGHCVMYAIR